MRIAIYVRTKRSSEVFAQEKAVREWAEQHGHQVHDLYRDVGESGSDPYRGGLRSMLCAAFLSRPFDAIVAINHSRLSRDAATMARMVAALDSVGVKVISLQHVGQECAAQDSLELIDRLALFLLRGAIRDLEASVLHHHAGDDGSQEQQAT